MKIEWKDIIGRIDQIDKETCTLGYINDKQVWKIKWIDKSYKLYLCLDVCAPYVEEFYISLDINIENLKQEALKISKLLQMYFKSGEE